MEYRNLGRSGLQVSIVGLGCNNFGMRIEKDATRAVIDAAIGEGITLFDTADIYGGTKSEEWIGEILQGRRDQVVLASKFAGKLGEGPMQSGASRRYIMQAVEASLRRLRTDYLDLYQVHFPDPKTPLEETMRALDDLVRQGKVRYIGHSNFSGWQTADAHWIAKHHNLTPFVSAQNEYNILTRQVERELVPAVEHFGVSLLPYFPLASGLLTGKYHKGEPPPEGTRLAAWGDRMKHVLRDENMDKVTELEEFAHVRGHTLLELAFGWLATKPCVASVIAGATSPAQVAANVAAGSWRLTPEEMAEVDKIAK